MHRDRLAARSSASAASWRAIGFCNGAPAAASHFLPRFGDPRRISILASATPSGSSRGAASRSSGRSRATGSSTSPRGARRSTEALASARAAVRRAVASSVGSVERAIGGGRVCDSDWRSRGARRRRGAPAAGSGHVSRHRDLRRQHRDSRGPVHLPAARCSDAGPRSSALLVIVMLTAYAFVVEGGSSVGRATLMAAIYFAAQLCDHRTLPVNVAALTAAILFCADPLQVVDAGFALTFGATLGILVGMSKFADAAAGVALASRARLRCSPRRRARRSRCCRSARSCSRASRSPASSSTSRRFR